LALLAPLTVFSQDVNEQTEAAMKSAVKVVAPSVVQIETSGGSDIIGTGGPGGPVRKGIGPTTGLVVGSDGYIISSAFNFANKPTAIFVTIPGRKERQVARVVATDHSRMLTLLKVNTTGLPVPAAVPRDQIQVGQWSLALGRALDSNLDNPPVVSTGIISAVGRIWGKAIQTDAKVSPVNYGGPLIDIAGRVQGVLIPASPFGEGDTAGVEWYDSGIGFAIPFSDVLAIVPRLKLGRDLNKGMLGIQRSSRDLYAVPTISAVVPESAAAKAGILPGDVIIEIDAKPIQNHAQVMTALGPKYEGDTVTVKVRRAKEEKTFANLVLLGSQMAYTTPFLGILPLRDDPELGLEIRHVFPKSPAEAAGLKVGDRILKIAPASTPALRAFSGRDQLMALVASMAPGTEIKIEVKRKDGGKTETVTCRLSVLENVIPDKLPEPASAKRANERPKAPPTPKKDAPKKDEPKKDAPKKDEKKEPKKVETGLIKRTNEARDHEYWIYVPENYDSNIAHGLVVWLHAAGKGGKDADDVVDIWRTYCEDHHLILVGPRAESDTGWVGSESDFIQQTIRSVLAEYTIDRQRVVAHGMGIGGQMAYYLGFNARDLVRGVVVTSAVLATQPKENLANQRLWFFIVAGAKDPLVKEIGEARNKLSERKFPVIHREVAEMGREYLTRPILEEIIRWIDSIDRI
jgi:S1-C subfamily serine protease